MPRERRLTRRLPGLIMILAVYAALAGLSDRVLVAALLALGGAAALHGVSRVKQKVLFEPLVPADAALLWQAVRYPALYIAYVGYARFVVIAGAGVAALVVLMGAEAAQGLAWGARIGLASAPVLSFLLTRWFFCPRCPLTLRPEEDRARYGLLSMLALYIAAPRLPMPPLTEAALPPAGPDAPHIVLIQAESFHDPRRFWPEPYRSMVQADLGMPVWDRLCAEGYAGTLAVPARGANTMRTEFAILGGRAEETLGFHKFNPLLSARHRNVETLVGRLAEAGYHTRGLHPYDGRFFGRSACYPRMGFHAFSDEAVFRKARRRGPYIADDSLGEAIVAVLDKEGDAKPCFVFAVTMENHGPWREGRYTAAQRAEIAAAFPRLPFPLAAYCYHLQGTDALLGRLVARASAGGRPLVLGLYGDHPPSFPGVQKEPPQPLTSFVIWPWRAGHPAGYADRVQASDFLRILTGEALQNQGVGACQGRLR